MEERVKVENRIIVHLRNNKGVMRTMTMEQTDTHTGTSGLGFASLMEVDRGTQEIQEEKVRRRT